MKYLPALFVLYSFINAYAQKHDNVWMFGYDSKQTIPGIEGSICEFDQNPGLFYYQPIALSLDISSTNIADSSGQLLFYTNGCAVVNAQHEVMENGEGLNPGEVHDIQCSDGYTAGPQSTLILSKPGNSDLYYLFHSHIIYVYTPNFDVVTDKLFFSLIDMSLNNGAGVVIEKNVPVITEPLTYGELTAVKHANGRDWWILIGGDQNNLYYYFLLTEQGITNILSQQIGMPASYDGSRGGQAVFSPNGKKYVRYSAIDGLYLFDFDREQGLLSNFQQIAIGDSVISGGVAISPNSRYLYVSSTYRVYQYDLWAFDIAATKDTVAIFDGFSAPFPTTFYSAQLAPDCRIYINSQSTVRYLHVINQPDEPGDACGFQQHGIPLPYNHLRSMPNFPNYRLGPLIPGEPIAPPCELIVGTHNPILEKEENKAWVFPNPAIDYVKVVFEKEVQGQWVLFDATGRRVQYVTLPPIQREHRIALDGVVPGIYFYQVLRQGVQGLSSGKLVIMGGR